MTKSKEIEMEFEMTEPEMDAALQLIQLSGDSGARTAEQSPEQSVGDSNEISSWYAKVGDLDALPRKRKRFRLIDEIYSITSPAVCVSRKRDYLKRDVIKFLVKLRICKDKTKVENIP
ncbi:uncharacterized protein LOC125197078 isoform X2 [Salvia hispanica]|uniref:uncharacterized protein LOC125197078 isoform X2 n=1 Tax=Salvia hispanica TaxID=49212 RepID=UPI002009B038|nr:uncharacterized protein LOC125197078 isoform X2 [Salvia hispanica]